MKRVLVAAAAMMALSACASDGMGYGGRGYGAADVAYYDNSYGSFYDGYWDGDVYYFRNDRRGEYRRDDGRHFRRDRAEGYREYRGHRGRQWR